jgi:PAS domain S-box-containing protein
MGIIHASYMSKKSLDYKAIIESMADMIIITDQDGFITYASPQWEAF